MADWIHLRDIVCYGYTGVLSEERALGQRFVVQVDLQVDLQVAAQSDHLGDTVDYLEILRAVRAIVSTQKFHLIEALAGAVAGEIKQDSRITQVRIEVCKAQPPIPDFTGSVCIEIWR